MAGGGRARPDAAEAQLARGASVARSRAAAGGLAGASRSPPSHASRPETRQTCALN